MTDDREKADFILISFFPVPPKPVDRDSASVKPRLVTRNGSRPCEFAGEKVLLLVKLPKVTHEEVEVVITQWKPDQSTASLPTKFRRRPPEGEARRVERSSRMGSRVQRVQRKGQQA